MPVSKEYAKQHSKRLSFAISDTSHIDNAISEYFEELMEKNNTTVSFELKRLVLATIDKTKGTNLLDEYLYLYKVRGFGKNSYLDIDNNIALNINNNKASSSMD